DQMREKRVELILQQLEAAPSLPAVAQSFAACGVADAIASLAQDLDFSAHLLKLIEVISKQSSSIDQFVDQRGFEPLRYAVLAVGSYQAFASATPQAASGSFDRDEYWKHCVAVGCCTEMLAEQMLATWGKDCQLELF